MILIAVRLLVLAWLPGAVMFRLPIADSQLRAALTPEERLFWLVLMAISVSM